MGVSWGRRGSERKKKRTEGEIFSSIPTIPLFSAEEINYHEDSCHELSFRLGADFAFGYEEEIRREGCGAGTAV